jgi:pyridoxal phosphate enzyme (YggS family)
VAVTKTVPADGVRAALAAGFETFGENRVQEGEAKRAAVGGGTWHLIGRLQSNKAGRAVATFDVIQSVDSVDLARRLATLAAGAAGARLPVYLQVNVDADPDKGGFDPAALQTGLSDILDLDGLEIRGLMTLGRLVDTPEDARPTFVRLRELSERLRTADDRLGAGLSMGMSDDFEVAVEEGATVVRIGRALFGERQRD